MKFLDFEPGLFISEIALDFPSTEIEGNDLLSRILLLVVEIRQENGKGSIGIRQSDDSESDGLGCLSLFRGYLAEIVGCRRNHDLSLALPAPNECLYGGEGGRCRATNHEIALEVVQEMADELISWVSSVQDEDTSLRNERQEMFGLVPLRRIHRNYGSCDRKASEDVIERTDKTLRIVSFTLMLESTLRIKLASHLLCGRKSIVGPIHAVDRHAMPEILRAVGPTLIGQFDRIIEDLPKDPPINLLACPGECAPVDRLGIRPKTTNPGMSKEFTGFHVHSFRLSADGNGQDEGDKLSKGEFSVSCKILRCAFLRGIDLSRNNVKKFFSVCFKLAWFFKA
jgi:hypothetical protein